MLLHYLVKFENSQKKTRQTITRTGKINMFYTKLSKVNKVSEHVNHYVNKCSNVQSECSKSLAPFTDRVVNRFLVQTVPFLLVMRAHAALPRP